MGVNSKAIQMVSLISGLMLLLFAYQNCGQRTHFESAPSNPNVSYSGNGGTYDGKPNVGAYFREFPNGCPATTNVNDIGLLQVTPTKAVLTRDLCTEINYGVSFSDSRLEYSFYNRDLLGLNGAIFESAELRAENSNPVELWCRSSNGQSGVDLVVKSNTTGFIYKGDTLTSGTYVTHARQKIAVQSSMNNQILSVQGPSENLQASVDLSRSTNNKFNGTMRLRGENYAVSCRVQSLGPSVLKQPENVIAILQMDETAGALKDGDRLIDSSENALVASVHNANGSGAALVESGRFSRALSLADSDDFIDFSQMSSHINDQISVKMSLKPSLTAKDDQVAFAINSSIGGNIIKVGTGMCSGTADREHLSLEIGNSCFDSGVPIFDQNWHDVVVTATSGYVNVFLDGAEVIGQPVSLMFDPSQRWTIGADYDPTGMPSDVWRGQVDEVAVWNTALTQPF